MIIIIKNTCLEQFPSVFHGCHTQAAVILHGYLVAIISVIVQESILSCCERYLSQAFQV